MNYGLYVSASGLMTNTYRQDVFANNLANVNTVAFKPDVAAIQARPSESVEDHLGVDVSRKMLDRLGGGVVAAPQRIAFTLGSPQHTSKDTDVYIEDPHGFFTVRSHDAQGQPTTMLSRDGGFLVSDRGELITSNGDAVLDQGGQPITLPSELHKLEFLSGGEVWANGEFTGTRVAVVRPADLTALEKAGGNRFALKRPTELTPIEGPVLQSGKLESSAADPVTTLMQMIAATKAATGNANMIRYHDTLMDRAINTLGRVA